MTIQVRSEYLRWITVYFWNTAKHAAAKEEALRLLPPTFKSFRTRLLAALKVMSQERFEELRNEARTWLFTLDKREFDKVLADYDRYMLLFLPAPTRINWSTAFC